MVKGRSFYWYGIDCSTGARTYTPLVDFVEECNRTEARAMAACGPSSNFSFHVLKSLKENSEKTLLVRLIKLASCTTATNYLAVY